MNNNMYNDLVMEYGLNSPYNYHLDNPTATCHGHNPNCGDDITLEVIMNGNKISDISFTGSGCAISISSVSFMIEAVKGKTLQQAKDILTLFIHMIQRGKLNNKERTELGNSVALENISDMPARVKCATMPWHTMQQLIDKINDMMSKNS